MMATINVMLNIAVLVSVNTPCMAFRALGNPTFSTNQLNIGGALFNSDTKRTITVHCQATRRDVCSCLIPASLALATLIVPNDPSLALSDTVTDDDLTTKMFNIDGSLKEGISSEVKYRNVSFKWDESDEMSMHKDGIDTRGTAGSQYMLDYQYPMRWSDGKDGDPIYFDRSEGINTKVAKGITIYQAPGKFKDDRLQRATTIGVAKAVHVPEDFPRLYKADTVSGRTVEKGSQIYYEFDMAAVSIFIYFFLNLKFKQTL